MGIPGNFKGEEAARAMVRNVSKYLKFAKPSALDWHVLVNVNHLQRYMLHLKAIVGVNNCATKIDNLRAALRFAKGKLAADMLFTTIDSISSDLLHWREGLGKKPQLRNEEQSEQGLTLKAITPIVESKEMWAHYKDIILRKVEPKDLKLAIGAVIVLLLFTSWQRPGAV